MISLYNKVAYVHFSFRKPKDKNYCIFAFAIYSDPEATNLIARKVVAQPVWVDKQFVKAIQSYNLVLEYIYANQAKLINANYGRVALVTDNSTLWGWIANPKKAKSYYDYVVAAYEDFTTNGKKELIIDINLFPVQNSEKAHKFCTEAYINEYPEAKKVYGAYGGNLSADEMKRMYKMREMYSKGRNLTADEIKEINSMVDSSDMVETTTEDKKVESTARVLNVDNLISVDELLSMSEKQEAERREKISVETAM